MNELLLELAEMGLDISGALERFMNNGDLYTRFLIKFLSDKNMPALKETLTSGNFEDALHYAHTLKGVTGNLGLTTLYMPLSSLVTCFRENRLDDIKDQINSIYLSYVEICSVIEKYS